MHPVPPAPVLRQITENSVPNDRRSEGCWQASSLGRSQGGRRYCRLCRSHSQESDHCMLRTADCVSGFIAAAVITDQQGKAPCHGFCSACLCWGRPVTSTEDANAACFCHHDMLCWDPFQAPIDLIRSSFRPASDKAFQGEFMRSFLDGHVASAAAKRLFVRRRTVADDAAAEATQTGAPTARLLKCAADMVQLVTHLRRRCQAT